MPDIFRSWKTTLAGIAMIGLVAALLMGRIAPEAFMAAFGLIAAGGFLAAKDHNVSGK